MTTHLYTLCWNDADMLGFFFRHYDPWIDRYFVFDDGSTDGSIELLTAHPRVELRRFERTHPESLALSHLQLVNEIWKTSRGRADWVVLTAIDEHLWVPQSPMATYLERCSAAGVTLVPAIGYQMLSDEFPGPDEILCRTRTRGARRARMDKLSLFDPNQIEQTHYLPGRHVAAPSGRLRFPERDELMLLHYKYLGFDRLVRRQAFLRTGLRQGDLANGWGIQYSWSVDQIRQDWDSYAAIARDQAAPGFVAAGDDAEPLWWRRTP